MERMSWRRDLRYREFERSRDIAESRTLLLEMVAYEPVIQQCFKIIESTCLAQGIHCKIDGTKVAGRFQVCL